MSDKTTLGDRMKEYESVSESTLVKNLPVILRVDGKSFHSVTKKYFHQKPFDGDFTYIMDNVAIEMCHMIMNAKFAYVQSDEISFLIHDYKTIETQPWFNNRVQKMCSVGASMAGSLFMMGMIENGIPSATPIMFDARVFTLPKSEVINYFIWRQNDCKRNSVLSCAQSMFSHKELVGLKVPQLKKKMLEKGFDWDSDLEPALQTGRIVFRSEEPEGSDRLKWKIEAMPSLTSPEGADISYEMKNLIYEDGLC